MVWIGLTSLRGAANRNPARLILSLLVALGLAAVSSPAASQGNRAAIVLHLDGAIGPASADYVRRGLAKAEARDAAIVVLRVDTPGGLDTSMRDLIRDIIASPIPVAAYVAPGGARAASAGTYILYASHLAVMAPGTNIGAATPVQLGGPQGLAPKEAPRGEPRNAQKDQKAQPAPAANIADAKAINDAVAYIRALAEMRGRNAEWAERAVRDAASLDARQAVAVKAVDFMARDVPDLLAQADGRLVTLAGAPATLRTKNLHIEHIKPDWRHRFLAAITNPNVALIFMMIGVYGMILEFMHPGALYPGTIGVISLIIALYALAILPVNYAGLALILLGIALMTAEAFTPSFGILGLGGGAAFVLGGMILIDTEAPGFDVSLPLVAGLAVASLAFSGLIVRLALTARRRRVMGGREEMIGCPGVVQDWSGEAGHVFAHSERWRAVSASPLQPGDGVRVVALDGLTLTVAPEKNGKSIG